MRVYRVSKQDFLVTSGLYVLYNSWRLCSRWYVSFYGGEDVDAGILGSNAVWTCRYIPTFLRNTWRQYVPAKRWYCPQITSWSPQGMRVLQQCTVPRAEIMFITIQRKNIHPQEKKWTRLLQCLNCPMFAVRLWITAPLYRWPAGSLPSTCLLCTPSALH
jgi:hypothetical protein